ncbi:MAG: CRTAC1 family protein [Thermoanaerobaculia bacterium]
MPAHSKPTPGRRLRKRSGLPALAGALFLLAGWAAATEPAFREVSTSWGLEFRHHHGGSGRFYMVETMGSGVVLFDYDGDGDADVLFLDSGPLPGYEGPAPRSRLFRNDGLQRFVDVSVASGIEPRGYAQGGAAGDVDRDGDLDLYITEFGANELFLNQGDGSFRLAVDAGAADPLWSSSAAFGDLDLDGDLDLYVTNYVDFSLDNNLPCGDVSRGLRSYCHPDVYSGVPDSMWLNDGRGRFSSSSSAKILGEPGKGLGVIFLDDDGDGLPDIYVANDMTANHLFRNRGDGRFEEEGLASGVAYSDRGEPEAGMGVAAGDLDGDGEVDIFVTHLDRQSNALYGRLGDGFYVDRRRAAGMMQASFDKVGFGTAFADVDNDGDLDVVVANGHIIHNIEKWGTGSTYRQANQVFVNQGDGRLVEAAHTGLVEVRSSRGLAVGDLDADGDLDLAINNSNDRAEVYENVTDPPGGWCEISLRGSASDRWGVGSRVELVAGGRVQVHEMRTASSYQSQSPLTLHYGLGAERKVATVAIDWPAGRRQRVSDPPAGRRLVFFE